MGLGWPFDNDHMKHIDRYHEDLGGEFRRLCAEPCMKTANPGDRVVVAVGLLSMGHPWVRREGVVLEVGGGSVKVRMSDLQDQSREMWIHPALIVDVFEAKLAD